MNKKYRAGIAYFAIGPFRYGSDSERTRDLIQNRIIHDNIGSPRFEYIDRPTKKYRQFTISGGNLW